MRFNRKILEGYLAVILVLLTVLAFIIIRGMSISQTPQVGLTNTILIILAGLQTLTVVLLLRYLEKEGVVK